MIELRVNGPSKKEIRDAIERLREMLIGENKNKENCSVGFVNKTADNFKPKKKEYNERISKIEEWVETFAYSEKMLAKNIGRCNSRLGRQGKDIYTLWKKVEVIEAKSKKMSKITTALIEYFNLDFQVRKTIEGKEEVRFVKKGKQTVNQDEMGLSVDMESEITKAEEELNRKLEKIIL